MLLLVFSTIVFVIVLGVIAVSTPFLCGLLPFHLSYVAVSWSCQLSEFFHNRTSAMPSGLENAVVI